MKRIAIVGGGIAGLTAAYELSRMASNGASVQAVLFEASPRLGGIVETVREGGFIIECGPDAWVTEKPWARELAEELGLANEIIPSNDATRKTYVLLNGQLKAMPDGMRLMVPSNLNALDQSDLFSIEAKQAFHSELDRAPELKASAPQHDESVADFVQRHFGNEVLDTMGAPLLRGVFGGDVTKLSVRAVMAPFVAMEREHGSLIAAMQANTAANKNQPSAIFTTLRNGLGTLVDSMIATIPKDWIRLTTKIRSISRKQDRWQLETSTSHETFDAVMMATPAHIARELLTPIDARAAQLMEMDASSAVVVAFGYPNATNFVTPPGFGFLVPQGSGSRLLACTFMDQKFDHRVPQNGKMVRAFFGGDAAERLMRCCNDEVSSVARLELAHILGPLPEPQVTVVRRWPKSLPQYAVGHLERMKELDERIQSLGGLYLLGNGYRGVGLPDLIRDARIAAQQVVQKEASQ